MKYFQGLKIACVIVVDKDWEIEMKMLFTNNARIHQRNKKRAIFAALPE